MEISTPLRKKYFVVVTHSSASQMELESILSSKRYKSFGTSQAKMFIEGISQPTSPPMRMEFTYPNIEQKNIPLLIKHDTEQILSTLEYEWLAAHSENLLNSFISVVDETRSITQEFISSQANALSTDKDTWQLNTNTNILIRENIEIALTGLEVTLVKRLLDGDERVVSKDELVKSIGREPELYRGLEMCLSRLQDKFKSASNGERLFRAVRNRGYCLIQNVLLDKIPPELME
ncbi:MAG TPA: winged helix-turn-helix domain-containing protein [Pseudomonas sp.]|uniref:winged helix-turn-helix domain-containing protein n=1 Tax=Pseudomonas sp. TaxID=306 RepID=UPI002ED77755